jgi:hypothetical protein
MKYFEKGIEVTRFKAKDAIEKSIRCLLVAVYLVYLAE